MAEEDLESQEDELLALVSIFDVRTFTRSNEEKGGQFNAFLDLPKPFKIRFRKGKLKKGGASSSASSKAGSGTDGFETLEVEHLPPVELNFRFPADYPSKSPPQYSLSCKWLTVFQLSQLCQCLDNMWAETSPGMVIIYEWVQFLKEYTLESLSISSPYTLCRVRTRNKRGADKADPRAFQDVASYAKLVATIIDYDQQQRETSFNSSCFTCNVCFSEKSGTLCISFHGCRHVYCQECMASYFKVQIEDGAVKAMTCPSHDCDSQALPSQVKQLVTPELFAKYDKFLLQSSLDGMSDVIYCPRPTCLTPVLIEKESSMGVCPGCTFAFCIFCKLAYHGIAPCKLVKPDDIKKLRDEYNAASKDEKVFLEKRYGKNQLRHIFDDLFTSEWLESNAKQCPNCSASIEKLDGCNKMTCTKCRCYFCWMCFAVLSRSNPYLHFNDPKSRCFNRLFEGVEMFDDDDDDDEWFYMQLDNLNLV